ncbi:hypothetical protein B0181_08455 [Moraxella caviae]|uniref:Lipoprotein n=1 Tax=Moraxella caviae TaxID=34060 RepID=A0A1S9ZXJ9_9GAMM|nr:hypothetical protein [Moraxella caviae]OOR88262.1 hypothetical protein B0181_08455 [Moraxella caviae]STZ13902.1 Uncharacterised protein [Moraxella caviae]
MRTNKTFTKSHTFIKFGILASVVMTAPLISACHTTTPQIPVQQTPAPTQLDITPTAINGALIVYFDASKKSQVLSAVAERGDTILYQYQNFNAIAIAPATKNTKQALHFYQTLDGVLNAVPEQTLQLH